ncbi:stage II sporulation protein M [Candidatus Woesearchaeota archaeon]|nr:stage II sporulation protein M [Candidatus Woesearchaeota archaeon]
MVLESLTNPEMAEKRRWVVFLLGIVYSSLAVAISILLFYQYAGLTIVFFTVLASVPLMYNTIKYEEGKDLEIEDERLLIKEHGKALAFFVYLFFGFMVSFSLWYALLPENVSESVFKIQSDTIREINSPVSGNAMNIFGTFSKILLNNVKVLVFCLIFAFLYGAGAIYILTWNAGIIAVAIVDFIKAGMGSVSILIPQAIFRYMIHGVPEIFAYFMGGLAGGIISVAVIRHDLRTAKAKHIMLDSLDLVFGALVMLIVAALLEVFVSPLIA